MNAILVSVPPEVCARIANGEQMILLMKRIPKLGTPYRVYMYCAKPSKSELFHHGCIYEYAHELIRLQDGKIVYDYGMRLACEDGDYSRDNFLCQKVIGEFMCDKIDSLYIPISTSATPSDKEDVEKATCLSLDELKKYANGKMFLYGLHISDLKIYDTPKELGEFKTCTRCKDWRYFDMCGDVCGYAENNQCDYGMITKRLTRPPQSWCYVEELSE